MAVLLGAEEVLEFLKLRKTNKILLQLYNASYTSKRICKYVHILLVQTINTLHLSN